jgi:hypothetical protein
MSEGKRERQYQHDRQQVADALAKHQDPHGNVEITVRVQDGMVTLIQTTEKWKPQKIEE